MEKSFADDGETHFRDSASSKVTPSSSAPAIWRCESAHPADELRILSTSPTRNEELARRIGQNAR